MLYFAPVQRPPRLVKAKARAGLKTRSQFKCFVEFHDIQPGELRVHAVSSDASPIR